MGRSNKKSKGRGQNHKPVNPVPVPVAPTVETSTDKRQNRRISLALVGNFVSLGLNVLLAGFAYLSWKSAENSARSAAEANALTKQAQDRVAGKVRAQFEFVEEKVQDSARFKQFMRKQDGYDNQVFRIESVDELVRWGPHVRIKNTGNEPIDALKIDVSYVVGVAYGVGVRQLDPVPVVLNEVSSHEATNFGKVMSGQTAQVGIGPLLLGQISRLNWPDYAEKDHQGVFSVEVSCRLVGATSYDQMDRSQRMSLTFHWRSAGFKHDARNVREYLAMKPSVEVK